MTNERTGIEAYQQSEKKMYVVCYYRKSSAAYDQQATSIEDQQREVRAYSASRGWIIVAEYIDSGKSGSKHIHKRIEFLRMVEDAKRGEWIAVVVWDTSRFGRLDSQRGAPTKTALRDAGVHLESVRQGAIDWASPQGRIMDTVLSESDHKYSTDLSANVLRGKKDSLAAGWNPHGRVPWGYDRALYCGGELKMIVPRAEKLRKPQNWKAKLIINEQEAEIIRWIFDRYGNHDTSMRKLCSALTARGIKTPSGKTVWSVRSIVNVLMNSTYVGDLTMGHKKGGVKGEFGQAKPQIGKCDAIIDRALWNIVAARVAERANKRRVIYDSATVKSGTLSGLLVCGHCGHNLSKKIDKSNGNVYYTCQSNNLRPGHGCHTWRIHESILLPRIGKSLAEAVDYELIQQIKAKPPVRATGDVDRLRLQISEAEKLVKIGTANLLKADSDVFPLLQKALQEQKTELEKNRDTLALLERGENQAPYDAYIDWWEKTKSRLITLIPGNVGLSEPGKFFDSVRNCWRAFRVTVPMPGSDYRAGDEEILPVQVEADKLRGLLNRLNVQLTIWWKSNGRKRFTLDRGIMTADFIPDQVNMPDLALCNGNIRG